MSSITFAPKIPLACSSGTLKGLLPDLPLPFVKVPQLAAGDHFLEGSSPRLRLAQGRGKVSAQSFFQAFNLAGLHDAYDSVGAKIVSFAANIADGRVH